MGNARDTWKQQLARIWNDVVSRDPAMAELSSAEAMFSKTPFLVASFVTAGRIDRYMVRVNHQPVAAETRLDHHPLNEKPGGELHQAEVFVLDSFEAFLPQDNPYRAVADAFAGLDVNARAEKEMSVQLLHELLHARLLIERDKGWPGNRRRLLPEFNAWAAPAWGNGLKADREALLQSMTAQRFEVLLDEKFVIQRSFAAFGVQVSNAQILRKYVRRFPQSIQKNMELALTAFFERLDLAHQQPGAPPGSAKPKPAGPAGPGPAVPLKTQPRRFPRLAPLGGREWPSAPFPRRYRPSPVAPRSMPPPNRPGVLWGGQPFRAGFPSIIQPRKAVAPVRASVPKPSPSRGHPGLPPRNTLGGAAGGSVRGRIEPIHRPSPFTTPPRDHFRRGGRTWDPQGYAFSNLAPYRWRPDIRVMEPATYGSKKMVWRGLVDSMRD